MSWPPQISSPHLEFFLLPEFRISLRVWWAKGQHSHLWNISSKCQELISFSGFSLRANPLGGLIKMQILTQWV